MAVATDDAASNAPERYGGVPDEMKAERRWVCTIGKRPINPHTLGGASSTNPATWDTFEQATARCAAGETDGIGFVLGDGFCGVDMDHVLDRSGALIEPFATILGELGPTYMEVSVSGEGIHAYYRGDKPDGANSCKKKFPDGTAVEMYDQGRYFKVTGERFGKSPSTLAAGAEAKRDLRTLYDETIGRDRRNGGAIRQTERVASSSVGSLDDEGVIQRIEGSRQGSEFRKLMAGDTSLHGGDDSSADMALANILAFYTNRDEAQTERIMRRSGLVRDKWDEKHGDATYLYRTIRKACDECRETVADAATRGAGKRRRDSTTPRHRLMADALHDCGACLIDGIPAVRAGQTYRHDGGWDAWDKALVERYPSSKSHERNEAIATVRHECDKLQQAEPKFVAFKNGVLNIETMELDTSGDYRILNVIPHDWNPDAESPELDSAMEAWADGDPATLARLEECAGQCLDRSGEIQLFWVLVGSGGNGKSMFTKTVGNALGPDNYTTVQPDELDRRFQGKAFMGKLACLSDDASAKAMTPGTVATLKRFTGNSRVYTDVKGRDPLEFTPYATIVVSYNRLPTVNGCDYGFMRRIQPIVFTHTFKPGSGGLIADRALMSEAAAERLLARAVDGLIRLRESGRPTNSARAEDMKQEIRVESDSFEAWRQDEEITSNTLDGLPQSVVLGMYMDWCEREHVTPMSRIAFYKRVNSEWSLRRTSEWVTHEDGTRTKCKVYRVIDPID